MNDAFALERPPQLLELPPQLRDPTVRQPELFRHRLGRFAAGQRGDNAAVTAGKAPKPRGEVNAERGQIGDVCLSILHRDPFPAVRSIPQTRGNSVVIQAENFDAMSSLT